MSTYPARIAPLITADQRLVDLTGRARAAFALLNPEARSAGHAVELGVLNAVHRSVAVHSLLLDGCQVTMAMAEGFDAEPGSATETGPIRQISPEGETDPLAIPRLEYQGMREVLAAGQTLVPGWQRDPIGALKIMHRMVTNGLAEDAYVGRWRETDQVMSDSQTGQAIYTPAPARHIEELMADLGLWVMSKAWRYDPLVVAGVVHWRILTVMPFPSANGRIARLAARLVLLASEGADADLLNPEVYWARDPMAYHREVGASLRRSGLAQWLNWQVWAVAHSAESVLRDRSSSLRLRAKVTGEVTDYVTGHKDFSIKDFATACEMSLPDAIQQLSLARKAGLVLDLPDGMFWTCYSCED